MKILQYKIANHGVLSILLIAFVIGLIAGKAIMSCASAAMLLYTLLEWKSSGISKAKIWQPLVIGCFAVFLSYLISGFYSDNVAEWGARVHMHSAMPIMALGILCTRQLKLHELKTVFAVSIAVIVLGTFYTLFHFLPQAQAVASDYGRGASMRTPFSNDHIRFALACVTAVLLCYYFLLRTTSNPTKALLYLTAAYLVVFIHILSSKAGLVCLYVLLLSILCHQLFVHKRMAMALLGAGMLVVLPIIAFKFVPTFKQRVLYFMYTIEELQNTSAQANISDEGRIISYTIAAHAIRQNPILGVGAGDVKQVMNSGYARLFANSQINGDKLLPHNQLLMAWLATGLLGLFALLYLLVAPLLRRSTRSFYVIALVIFMFVPILAEPMHETQYGIAIHIFFLLLLCRAALLEALVQHD
ncbi:MAG: hypothetical protein RL660_2923 [Bacteroidota bacterium]